MSGTWTISWILARSRRVFRRAIKAVHQVLRDLQLRLHTKKRFIGRGCRGFDFLGYTVTPGRRLRPSAESHRVRLEHSLLTNGAAQRTVPGPVNPVE